MEMQAVEVGIAYTNGHAQQRLAAGLLLPREGLGLPGRIDP